MARSETTSANHKLLTLVTIVVAVAGLRLAREVLIPLALAILFSFLLAPLVRRIERLGLWRIPSVLLVTVLAMTAVIGTGYILAGQLVDLSDSLPQYRSAIRERAYLIRSGASAALGRASENIRELSKDLATTQAAPTSVPAVATQPPVPVQVVDYSGQPLEWIQTALGSLLSPILTAGVVAIFVFFILLQREDLRDRLIRLAGQERVDVTTQALDDTARRISRYLLMQATVNTCLGLLVAAGLWLIGIPNAVLWGMMATALRFIPYVGIWIAAAGPMILSLAVFSGWMAPVAVVGLYIGLEILVANFIEPLVYGGSTGLSPLAVLVAAIFWAWLWGPVGLLLSTPLTVCMVVLGKYTPTLSFLTVLLGDQPVLNPAVRFYQRLLAGDQEDAEDLAEDRLDDEPLAGVYDQVVVPGLRLVEMDRHRGRLEDGRVLAIHQAVREIVENLHDREREIRPVPAVSLAETASVPAGPVAPHAEGPSTVLCLPARDEADETVATMLAQVLGSSGGEGRVLPVNMMVSEMLDEVAAAGSRIVCISAVPPEAMARTRYLCKRLKTRLPQVKVIVGFWDPQVDLTRVRARLLAAGADHVVGDFAGLLQVIRPSLTMRMVLPAGER
jgi:predicted PurR-regulated permease PerM